MAGYVYLDSEDEITTAAARIRSSRDERVVLVLPFGSRVATSRINFRLLAREAESAGRRLDIVAPDASTRALAASAGLAVFASVTEADEALAGPRISAPTGDRPATPASAGVRSTAGMAVRETRAPDATAGSRRADGAGGPSRDALGSTAARQGADGRTLQDEATRAGTGRSRPPVRRLVVLGVLALVVGVGGYAGWTLLPAADITLTPRVSPLGPVSITVRADPTVTAVDPAGGVIPASVIELPVSVSGQFAATGKRVQETLASGEVQFDSINTVFAVPVAQGTRVSTLDGILFETTSAVTVPKATVSGSTIQRGVANAGIRAIATGTGGNVAAGSITQVPASLSAVQISVTNPAATTGGTHTETTLVRQTDVDAAVASLRKDLGKAFTAALAAPRGVPAGATVFGDTATMGDATPDPAPGSLVGKEVTTFSLQLSAAGSVLAVDASPVRAIAEARLVATVESGHTLMSGSVDVSVGPGTVTGGVVSFNARASGAEVVVLDAAALRHDVLGMSRASAEALLAQYGVVRLGLWPDWAADVPAIDARVTLTVLPPETGSPSPSPSASAPSDSTVPGS